MSSLERSITPAASLRPRRISIERQSAKAGAHFTFVTRYGKVALDDYRMRRTTLGLNFRPNETHTVVKLDYLMNDDSGSQQGTNNDNAWAMSVATYF